MSLLAMPVAASSTTSRSRPESGSAVAALTVARWRSPGVWAPFAGRSERGGPAQRRRGRPALPGPAELRGRTTGGLGRKQRCAQRLEVIGGSAEFLRVARPGGGGMPGARGYQWRVARVGKLAQPGGDVLAAGAHQVVQQPRLGEPVAGRGRLRGRAVRNVSAASASRCAAVAAHASARRCSGPRKPNQGTAARSASACAAASGSPSMAWASARPDRAMQRRAGEVVRLSQPGRLGVVAAGGRQPSCRVATRPRFAANQIWAMGTRCEATTSAPVRASCSALAGRAGLGQGEHLNACA